MRNFENSNFPGFPGIQPVVTHLYEFVNTPISLSTRELHVNTNILNYYVFNCIPSMYDNIKK